LFLSVRALYQSVLYKSIRDSAKVLVENGNILPVTGNQEGVLEDKSRLSTIRASNVRDDANFIVESLKEDQVILVQDLDPDEADDLIALIAEKFDLSDSLELQTGMASTYQRENVGGYFMTVDKRKDYQFVSPHSEGSSFINMQLAAFYCYENTIDGGETILMNVDQSSNINPGTTELCVGLSMAFDESIASLFLH